MAWKSYRGGKQWRTLEDGRVEIKGEGIPRTSGEPLTMRYILSTYRGEMQEAAQRFDVPLAWIAGMIPIEARMIPLAGGGSQPDPVSLRHEPGYFSDATTPHRVSAGLLQTLLSTARDMARKHDLPHPRVASDLYDPRTSILLGAAYMRHQMDRYSDGVERHPFDFVHLTGAYNAGSIKYSKDSRFRLLTYSPTRTDRAIKWLNDAIAVLSQEAFYG